MLFTETRYGDKWCHGGLGNQTTNKDEEEKGEETDSWPLKGFRTSTWPSKTGRESYGRLGFTGAH